jgi:phosphoserine phosphatase
MEYERKNRKVAIMYDFDDTLSSDNVLTFELLPLMDVSFDDFLNEIYSFKADNKMDMNLSFLYYLTKKLKEKGIKANKDFLLKAGEKVTFFPGVEEWFERINKYGNERGIEIEHYIISSGVKEIILGSSIAKNFKKIYASEFYYNSDGEPEWPSVAVNYTNKTQFIYRINRGVLNVYDDSINDNFPKDNRNIPYENMVFIGDGFTDIPCLRLVKNKGGRSILVGNNSKIGEELFTQEKISLYTRPDYRENSEIDTYIKEMINNVAINAKKND